MNTAAILGCITIAMALLGGVVSTHAPGKLAHKITYLMAFPALGIAAGLFTVKSSMEAGRSSAALTDALKELEKATGDTTKLQTINNQQSEQIIKLSAKLGILAEHGISTTTGGNSFCVMLINFQTGLPVPILLHRGKYPLYEVVARNLLTFRKFAAKYSEES